jgi:putative intracellular protease/amidase
MTEYYVIKHMIKMDQLRSLVLALICTGISLWPAAGHAQLKDFLNKAKQTVLTGDDGEIGLGLKQALEFGVNEAVEKLSADKGYLESPYKVLIPEEAQAIVSKVKMVPGFQDVEKQLIEKMNKAAELAAKKATPIFVDAIKSLTIRDAMNILMGEKDAATRYLETETRTQLYTAFLPVIQSALDEVNAREYWKTVINAYNNIPFVKKANPALDDHVNQKALDGMFSLIEVKESRIRGDQSERKTDLLKKVFAQQDKG